MNWLTLSCLVLLAPLFSEETAPTPAATNAAIMTGQEWLKPWKPTDEDPWTRKKAAHLLRRAGFGGGIQEIEIAYQNGLERAVNNLIHYERIPNPIDKLIYDVQKEVVELEDLENIQRMWLFRMSRTMHPLKEKMTLFWHGHFATANYKVDSPYFMMKQIELFRKHALGNFRDLLIEVSRDPAMIIWLDNQTNVKGSPNENYAREVFELFSLGIENYTEKDIQEAARAFTGWQVSGLKFRFNESKHDFGEKTVFGNTGNFNGEDIVDMAVSRPAAGRHLARKLLKFFVLPNPDPGVVEAVADLYLKSKYDMRKVMDTILRSKLFYSKKAYRSLVKSPAELVLGTTRLLDCRIEKRFTLQAMQAMGQELYNPPNVKGWDGDRAWINTITTLKRDNYLRDMLMQAGAKVRGRDHYLLQFAKQKKFNTPEEVVDFMVLHIVQGDLSESAFTALKTYFKNETGTGGDGADEESYDYKLRRLAYIIMTSPAYQAN